MNMKYFRFISNCFESEIAYMYKYSKHQKIPGCRYLYSVKSTTALIKSCHSLSVYSGLAVAIKTD
jgi:hypothetical protein